MIPRVLHHQAQPPFRDVADDVLALSRQSARHGDGRESKYVVVIVEAAATGNAIVSRTTTGA